MVTFSNAFGLTREEDAHAAFMSLLSSTFLPMKLRTAVTRTYELWCMNEGVVYWVWRSAGRRVDVSTGMIVEALVDRGQHFTTKILQLSPNDNGANAQLHGMSSALQIHSSTVEIAAESGRPEQALQEPDDTVVEDTRTNDIQL